MLRSPMRWCLTAGRSLAWVLSLTLLSGSCRSATVGNALAATYSLAGVVGRGATSGWFILRDDGTAERHVWFEWNGNAEEVDVGRYQIDGRSLEFFFGTGLNTWSVRGEVNATHFTFMYPDAADGPDIVETYRRR